MKNWNKLYKNEITPFGSEPSLLIKKYAGKFPRSKPILDLGSGDGRNALFLVNAGHNVTCVDISAEALNALNKKAKELGVGGRIITVHKDAKDFKFERFYEGVVCFTLLHFLKDSDARRLLSDIQKRTNPGGINIIADFVGDGPLKSDKDYFFWLKEGELKTFYDGWDILFYNEELGPTKAKDKFGKNFMQRIAKLVAIKP